MVAQRIGAIPGIDDVVPARLKRRSERWSLEKAQAVGMALATATSLTAVGAAVVAIVQG